MAGLTETACRRREPPSMSIGWLKLALHPGPEGPILRLGGHPMLWWPNPWHLLIKWAECLGGSSPQRLRASQGDGCLNAQFDDAAV